MPSSEKIAAWSQRLVQLTQAFASVKSHPRAADADIFLKAVRYAIEFEEWYGKKPEDSERVANALLDEASQRIDALQKNKTPWMDGSGQKTLGFYSSIDGSPQPYGVEVPEGLAFGANQPSVPMWIWLHGRGDTTTDLQFVYSRLTAKKLGQFQPKGTIELEMTPSPDSTSIGIASRSQASVWEELVHGISVRTSQTNGRASTQERALSM